MKKAFIGASLLSIAAFTGCIEETGNRFQAGGVFGTIVENSSNKVVEMEQLYNFYYADEINNDGATLKKGDRIYVEEFAVDYDHQPSGVTGQKTNPLQMTAVKFQKVESLPILTPSDQTSLMKDSLELFYSPYVTVTTIGPYLNMTGSVMAKGDAKYALVFDKMVKDTIFYDFRAQYITTPSEKDTENYLFSCPLTNVSTSSSRQYIKVNFAAKKKNGQNGAFKGKSTWEGSFVYEAGK